MNRIPATILFVTCLATTWLGAQSADLPKFDVASVKQDTSGEQPANNWQRSPGRIDYQNTQILQLIRAAYGDTSLRIEGAPGWTMTERYDVDVRFPVGATNVSLMLRQLLIERFKMQARIEMRPAPIYSLVPAGADRRLGPKLQPASAECAPGPLNAAPLCQSRISASAGTMVLPYIDMAGPAQTLSVAQQIVGRRVVNNTGLTGFYRVELQFAPVGPETIGGAAAAGASQLPSIFTALQEQLGLRLDSATGTIQILVVDSIERPTPD